MSPISFSFSSKCLMLSFFLNSVWMHERCWDLSFKILKKLLLTNNCSYLVILGIFLWRYQKDSSTIYESFLSKWWWSHFILWTRVTVSHSLKWYGSLESLMPVQFGSGQRICAKTRKHFLSRTVQEVRQQCKTRCDKNTRFNWIISLVWGQQLPISEGKSIKYVRQKGKVNKQSGSELSWVNSIC